MRILGVFIDVKSINIYHFRPFILQLCKYRHLELKDHDNLVGMFENSLLDGHLKTLENLYHEFVLTRGDFDERVFLNNKADERIGTPVKEKVKMTHYRTLVGCKLYSNRFQHNKYIIKFAVKNVETFIGVK